MSDAHPDAHPDALLDELLDLALEAGRAGGHALLSYRPRLRELGPESKGVRRELVTVADRAAEDLVVGTIQSARPQDAILAEEGVHSEAGVRSNDGELCWIIDPLDGTTNYVHGVPNFCVAIGLCDRDDNGREQPLVSVIHAPALGTTYTAVRGRGAFRDGKRLEVSPCAEIDDALLATGFAYHRNDPDVDDNVDKLSRALAACRDVRRFGSAELDLCWVAEGIWDGYWEMGLMPYDVAAGALVVREAGGRVSDLHLGEDWMYGKNVMATNGRLHDALHGLVGHPPA